MRNILYTLLVSTSFIVASDGVMVTMPARREVKDKLKGIASDFAENSAAVEWLGGKTITAYAVYIYLWVAKDGYIQEIEQNMDPRVSAPLKNRVNTSMNLMLEALLQNEPKALRELYQMRAYRPSKSSK